MEYHFGLKLMFLFLFANIAGEIKLWLMNWANLPQILKTYTSLVSMHSPSLCNVWYAYGNNTCHTGEILNILQWECSLQPSQLYCTGRCFGGLVRKCILHWTFFNLPQNSTKFYHHSKRIAIYMQDHTSRIIQCNGINVFYSDVHRSTELPNGTTHSRYWTDSSL